MALSAAVVWEVRTTGSDTNGGAFDPSVVSPGTDYSQQVAAQIAVTDVVTNGTATITSATASFSAAHVGNVVYMTGTGVTTGRYTVVTFTNSTTVVLDSSPGTGTGGTLNLGGALQTLDELQSARGMVASNAAWVKATAAYSLAANFALPAGVVGKPTRFFGYTTTRGDTGQITVNAANTNGYFAPTGSYFKIANVIMESNGNNIGFHFFGNAYKGALINCLTSNVTSNNYGVFGITELFNCGATNKAGATGAIAFECFNNPPTKHIGCVAKGAFLRGFDDGGFYAVYDNCIADGCDVGFNITKEGTLINNCVASGGSGDGVATSVSIAITNSIFSQCGGYGINSAIAGGLALLYEDYNFFYSNTAGNYFGLSAGIHDVALSGNPFTNAAGHDFSLNNTAGAGAAVRAAGFPGAFNGISTTGYLDGGAVQHQDTPSTTTVLINKIENIFLTDP